MKTGKQFAADFALKNLNSEQFVDMLKERVRRVGRQIHVAQALNISPQYLSDILRGKREPSQSVAEALGYTRKVVYEPARSPSR